MDPINISTSEGFFRWVPAARLRVGGDDAAQFLQGQHSNDLRVLPQQPAVYGLWLTLKGKIEADSFVLRESAGGDFILVSYASPAAALRERLERFVIADDVSVTDETAGWRAVTVFGAGARAAIGPDLFGGVLFPGRRDRAEHWEWLYPESADTQVAARLAGWTELSAAEMERRRIAAGIPAVPRDLGPNDLPNEGGLDADAVSYTKGCYLGQEVMARLKSMGQVRRRLVRVRAAGGVLPPVPAPLYAGDKVAGELRSAVTDGGGAIGLAMISLLTVGAARALALQPGGPANVEIAEPL